MKSGTGGLVKDVRKAIALFRLSADQGLASARVNLGMCLKSGGEKNVDEAVRLFKLAVEQEFASAYNSLASCYLSGCGVAKDESEAVRLFRLAADKSLVAGQYGAPCLTDQRWCTEL